jgi:O-antigen ligase
MPLFAFSALVGVVANLRTDGKIEPPLFVSLLLLLIAVGVQLVPLSFNIIDFISPETDTFLRRFLLGYSAFPQRHALSIDPSATTVALVAASTLAVFLLGLTRSLTRSDTVQLARGLTVLGVVLAILGIVQKDLWNGKIYWFWTPNETGDSFGPFVNHNHFAGWMLMAIPLSVGYLCGRVARGMSRMKAGFRERVLWFASVEASETILVGFGVLLMSISLTLTLSRSGILGLLGALILAGLFVAWRQRSRSRVILLAYLAFVALGAVGWAGIDRFVGRFSPHSIVGLGGRRGIWADTWQVAKRFPLVGTGLNTFSTAMVLFQTTDRHLHYAQAHSDYLQLLAEGGMLVCVPVGLVALACALTARRRLRHLSADTIDYWIRIGAVTGVVAILLQEAADFSLQMPGNALLFVVLLSLVLRRSRMPISPDLQRAVTGTTPFTPAHPKTSKSLVS